MTQYPLKQRIHSVNMLFCQGSKLFGGCLNLEPNTENFQPVLIHAGLNAISEAFGPKKDGKGLVYTYKV